ncbi:MAG: hypothetical protein AAGG46_09235, partial [Planctomycetota bacterium]
MPRPDDNPPPGVPPREETDAPDELLSALIDDELSDAERQAVERRLASDPATRELVESFRHMSTELDALDKPSAPDGLASAIADRVAVASSPGQTPGTDAAPISTRSKSVRRWVGAGIAVAASLLLVVLFDDGPTGDAPLKEVALAEPAAETGGVPPAADPDSVADSVAADEIASASEPPVAASTPA